ncbi:MAG: GxxExxY protein [Spirochaetaceae bacterium]
MAQVAYKELSHKVLGAAFAVHNALGPGLLESAYEGALVIELRHRGLDFERQRVFPVYYRGEMAGAYVADLVVEGKVIMELKSVKKLTSVMEAQLVNYLRLSKVPVGYLLNFQGTKVEWRRFVVGT